MSTLSVIQKVLLILLIAFTLINLYYLTVGRKRKKSAQAQFRQILNIIEQQAVTIAKHQKLPIATQMGYLNDQNQGVLLTFDAEGKLAVIFLDGEHHVIKADQFVGATQRFDQADGNKITNITVEVETTDLLLNITFGGGAYRPASYLGKFILKDSKDFCERLINHFAQHGDQ